MKLALCTLLGLGAIVLAGCGSTVPTEDFRVQATNPAQVVEEVDGAQYVYLTEGPAYFAEDSIRVKAGKVIFYVSNEADQDVSLVVVPAGERAVDKALFRVSIPKGGTVTHEVELAAGAYEYCSPANQTEWYPLEVAER